MPVPAVATIGATVLIICIGDNRCRFGLLLTVA